MGTIAALPGAGAVTNAVGDAARVGTSVGVSVERGVATTGMIVIAAFGVGVSGAGALHAALVSNGRIAVMIIRFEFQCKI